jgi:hypothetical protein
MQATTVSGARHARVFVFEELQHFTWEIEHYVWDFFTKGALKGLSKQKPRKRGDHLMNAFQYLCALRPRGRGRVALSKEEKIQEAGLNSYF